MALQEKKEYSVKKVIVNSSIYSITNILQKALSFFLLPLYTIFLTPGDYGLVALISSFFGFIALLITLALNGAVSRFFFFYKNDERKLKEFLGTIIIGIIFNCLLWFILILSFRNLISSVFLKNIEFFPYVFIALISTVTSPIYSIYQTILQIKQDAKGYSTNSLIYFIFAVSLNLLFIVGFKLGAKGLLLANTIPSVLFSIIAIITLIHKKHIALVFRWAFMLESLRYAIPLIPHLLSGTIADYISKSILNIKSNLANIGLFNLAFQFGSLLDIIQSSINSAFVPMVFDTLDNHREAEQKIIKTTTIILKFVCFSGLAIAMFSKEIVVIMTSNIVFHKAWKAIPIIILGALFQNLYISYSNLVFYHRKATRFIWIASLSGNLVHIIFSVWFTSMFIYFTPAIAGVLQRVIMFILVFRISRRFEPVKYELNKMMLIILLFVVAVAIGLAPDILVPKERLDLFRFIWKAFVFMLATTILLYEDRYIIKTQITKYI